jgi:hypothetical protein
MKIFILSVFVNAFVECKDLEKREISFAIPRGSNAYYLRFFESLTIATRD